MIQNSKKLTDFLIDAKKTTYAGEGNLTRPSRPESKDFKYEDDDYYYIDSYLGGTNFVGEEIVGMFNSKDTIWGMNYYGYMLVEKLPKGFSAFLKKSLKNVPVEAPFRGPANFKELDYEYNCNWNGDIYRFRGKETIKYKGHYIYELVFHGGEVKI